MNPCISVVFLASLLVPVRSDLIVTTCNATPFPDLCTTTLQSDPSGATATDVPALVRVIMDADLNEARSALDQIHFLLQQPHGFDVDRALAFCAETYRPIVNYALPQGIEALAKGEFKFANDGAVETGNQVDACDKKVSGSVMVPEVSDMNKVVRDLSAVASSILNSLSG